MAVAAAFPVAGGGLPVLIRDVTSLSGSIHPHRTSGLTRRSAVSVEQQAAAAIPPQRRILLEKKQADSAVASSTHYDESKVPEIERRGLKDFFEESRDLIKSDGGPPRWFSPLDCASPADTSPLLLYLPGLDGVGLGLILHHQKLGRIFEVWCLHIPVMDRTTFSELVNIVERTVRSEYCRFPNRPIFLVGESLGGCLALVIAARNHDIDLTIISANPATSFGKSPLQPLIPLLEVMPPQLDVSLPHMLSLMTGDPFKMAIANMGKMLSVQKTVGELSQGLLSLSSFLSVLTNMLPRETLLWKLEMLKSASAFTNSRLHAVTAPVLILTSGKDQLLPSMEEGVRLRHALPKCEIHKFEDSGHFLFLEDGVDLAMTIKAAGFYRRGRNKNYVSDYVPPTPSEFLKIYEPYRWIEEVTGTAMFSTLGDGMIVKGLGGIPSEGPVLLVGYHMLLGLELYSLVARYFREKNVVLRGIAHPLIFSRTKNGKLPDSSQFDTFRLMGAVPVSGMNLYRLLSSKSHALLYPGGMREALHRKGEEYKLFWPEQSEFVRMAARFGATIVPFGSVGEDDFGQVVFDYDDLVNIPYFKNEIERLTNEAAKLRTDAGGEVSNQQVHLPGILPKFPGRFYYLFGKPIETAGRKQELADREKARELYIEIKSEVERCIDYLKEKREEDPYRYLIPRLIYQAMQGFSREAPTFVP